MKVYPDDDVYRVRLVYLGPPGYTLPVQFPFPLWGLIVAVTAVCVTAGYLLTGSWDAFGVSVAAAGFITYAIWRKVDQDLPIRAVLAIAWADRRRIQPPKARPVRIKTSGIVWRNHI